MNLRFHWMLPKGGEVKARNSQTALEAARYRILSASGKTAAPRPDLKGWGRFARHAETAGIDSTLISFSRYEPDPLVVACALGQATKRLKFIVAYRSGLIQPTTFVQQFNTLSALIQGRLSLNIVAGSSAAEQHGYGDFLAHDERYERAEEFLAVCNSFWRDDGDVDFEGKHYRVEKGKLNTPFLAPDRTVPEIYISGHSEASERLARTQGSCWLRVVDTPEKLKPVVSGIRASGIEVCLRLCLLCRPTREEAYRAALELLPEDRSESTITSKDDSQMYGEARRLGDDPQFDGPLWKGLVPHYGPVWTTLVGSPRDLADAFLSYKEVGVSQFIISGWPEVDTIDVFGQEVLPLVREGERQKELSMQLTEPLAIEAKREVAN
ncbi:MAG TPA: LLM class flavin-dependent oxidoreductase [Pyrinomonadaceae bacterium]|nr:LLM class flavin-dependent oxidoreductase [Pyrinomonadaceae bacterium]